MIVFSGDFDKALAFFTTANGAVAYGKQVSMFFTFWGFNVIKRPQKVSVAKRGMERMFDIMLPSHAGTKMIEAIMKQKNGDRLSAMIA